jgi:hypothetical protein
MTRIFGKCISVRPVYLVEVRHETNQHFGFDFMCVLRIRGMGSAVSLQGTDPVGRVPQAQHDALEPV